MVNAVKWDHPAFSRKYRAAPLAAPASEATYALEQRKATAAPMLH